MINSNMYSQVNWVKCCVRCFRLLILRVLAFSLLLIPHLLWMGSVWAAEPVVFHSFYLSDSLRPVYLVTEFHGLLIQPNDFFYQPVRGIDSSFGAFGKEGLNSDSDQWLIVSPPDTPSPIYGFPFGLSLCIKSTPSFRHKYRIPFSADASKAQVERYRLPGIIQSDCSSILWGQGHKVPFIPESDDAAWFPDGLKLLEIPLPKDKKDEQYSPQGMEADVLKQVTGFRSGGGKFDFRPPPGGGMTNLLDIAVSLSWLPKAMAGNEEPTAGIHIELIDSHGQQWHQFYGMEQAAELLEGIDDGDALLKRMRAARVVVRVGEIEDLSRHCQESMTQMARLLQASEAGQEGMMRVPEQETDKSNHKASQPAQNSSTGTRSNQQVEGKGEHNESPSGAGGNDGDTPDKNGLSSHVLREVLLRPELVNEAIKVELTQGSFPYLQSLSNTWQGILNVFMSPQEVEILYSSEESSVMSLLYTYLVKHSVLSEFSQFEALYQAIDERIKAIPLTGSLRALGFFLILQQQTDPSLRRITSHLFEQVELRLSKAQDTSFLKALDSSVLASEQQMVLTNTLSPLRYKTSADTGSALLFKPFFRQVSGSVVSPGLPRVSSGIVTLENRQAEALLTDEIETDDDFKLLLNQLWKLMNSGEYDGLLRLLDDHLPDLQVGHDDHTSASCIRQETSDTPDECTQPSILSAEDNSESFQPFLLREHEQNILYFLQGHTLFLKNETQRAKEVWGALSQRLSTVAAKSTLGLITHYSLANLHVDDSPKDAIKFYDKVLSDLESDSINTCRLIFSTVNDQCPLIPVHVAEVYSGKAKALRKLRRIDDAEAALLEGLSRQPSRPIQISLQYDLGLLLCGSGRHREAISYLLNAAKTAEELKNHALATSAYIELGFCFRWLLDFQSAYKNFKKADALAVKHHLSSKLMRDALDGMGDCYHGVGYFCKAESYYLQAMAHAVQVNDENAILRLNGNLATISSLLENSEKAIDCYTEILKESSSRSICQSARFNRACACHSLSKKGKDGNGQYLKAAISDFTYLALQHYFSVCRQFNLKLNDPSAIRKISQPFTQAEVECYYRLQEAFLSLGHSRLALATYSLHSQLMISLRLLKNIEGGNVLPSCLTCVQSEGDIRTDNDFFISVMEQLLAFLKDDQTEPIMVLSFPGNYFVVWAVYLGDDGQMKVTCSYQAAKENLFGEGDTFYPYLCKIADEMNVLNICNVGPVNLSSALGYRFYDSVNDENVSCADMRIDVNLIRYVLPPIKKAWQNICQHARGNKCPRNLAIIADNYCKAIPLSLLPATMPKCASPEPEGPALFETCILHYAPSLVTSPLFQTVVRHSSDCKKLLAGNPLLWLNEDSYQAYGRLPEAEEEVVAIGRVLGGKAITGADANLKTIKQQSETASIIHMATHCREGMMMWAPDVPSILNRPADLCLTYSDIERIQLSGQPLVFLAGCLSSRGEIKGGETLSTINSFLSAGAAGVISCSMNVPELSSPEFTILFYDLLMQGISAKEALKRTSQMMRLSPGFSGAWHWSGYQYDGRNVQLEIASKPLPEALQLPFTLLLPGVLILEDVIRFDRVRSENTLFWLNGPYFSDPVRVAQNFVKEHQGDYPGGVFWMSAPNQNNTPLDKTQETNISTLKEEGSFGDFLVQESEKNDQRITEIFERIQRPGTAGRQLLVIDLMAQRGHVGVVDILASDFYKKILAMSQKQKVDLLLVSSTPSMKKDVQEDGSDIQVVDITVPSYPELESVLVLSSVIGKIGLFAIDKELQTVFRQLLASLHGSSVLLERVVQEIKLRAPENTQELKEVINSLLERLNRIRWSEADEVENEDEDETWQMLWPELDITQGMAAIWFRQVYSFTNNRPMTESGLRELLKTVLGSRAGHERIIRQLHEKGILRLYPNPAVFDSVSGSESLWVLSPLYIFPLSWEQELKLIIKLRLMELIRQKIQRKRQI